MKLTLKTKLEVNDAQHRVLDRMAFACTKLWNTANYERRQAWGKTGKIPSYVQQCKRLKDNPWARLLQSQSAQAVLQKLDLAYCSWYKLRKVDKTARPPGFRKKESLSTITFKRSAFMIDDTTLRLSLTPKLRDETGFDGRFLYVKFDAHRPVEGDPCLVERAKTSLTLLTPIAGTMRAKSPFVRLEYALSARMSSRSSISSGRAAADSRVAR